jgi:hypothetical protein
MAVDLLLAAHTFSGLCFSQVHLRLQRQLVDLGTSLPILGHLLLGGQQHLQRLQPLWFGYQLHWSTVKTPAV